MRMWMWMACLWLIVGRPVEASVGHPMGQKALSTLVFPGRHTVRLDHLEPEFRVQIETLIERMEGHGYRVRVESTYRSERRQDFLYRLPLYGREKGVRGGFTNAPGGHSCHNSVGVDGQPASLAVDLWGYRFGPLLSLNRRALARHAEYFEVLGEEAKALGLNWGGDFSGESPWQSLGIGKDPPHVSSKRCRWK